MWRDCVEGRVVDNDWQNAADATSEIGVQQSVGPVSLTVT